MIELLKKIFHDADLFIASIALITSIISIIVGVIALCIQRSHNKKSVRPIGTINLSDFLNRICIKIANNGTGPMIITACKTVKEDGEEKPYPIDWMPPEIVWTTFRKGLEDCAVYSGDSLTLLQLEIDKDNPQEAKVRDEIREILKDLELQINYLDIYGKKFVVKRKLDWFGR